MQLRDVRYRRFERELHFRERRDRHPQRNILIQHVILAHVAMGQHIVAQLLRRAQAGAMSEDDPRVRSQYGDVIGDGLGIAGPTPMLTIVMPMRSSRTRW